MTTILERLGVAVPIIQAPMAGVSTPELAATVSNAGALGSIAVGASNAASARTAVTTLRAATDKPFNVNVFVHTPAHADPPREAAWLTHLAPYFQEFGAVPPPSLKEIYPSFNVDDDMLKVLLDTMPPVVSFHFGLPTEERVTALKAMGALLFASVTSLAEAQAAQRAGMDAVIAQGFEAGGHRGVFDPTASDDELSTLVLTRLLVQEVGIPVIAAGGIMDGAGIAAVLRLGAVAAQMGTAFIACSESSATPAFRAALLNQAAAHTVMTTAISGRPARCLVNRFTALGETLADVPRPDYPIAYDAGKALHAAASATGDFGYGTHWAGQGAPLARAMPAQELVATLVREMEAALGNEYHPAAF